MDSTNIEMPDVALSQKEKTPKRRNKRKGLAEQVPSSSKNKSLMEDTPRWLTKEVMVKHKRKLYFTEEEGMRGLI